jgi:hypothetical protein
MIDDVKFALRMPAKTPGFTIIAMLIGLRKINPRFT